ncbi:HpcH/HpaI aldolase/citrate lyase family protein [Ciceribacter sp. L1K22]|uniref:aldolase/citrate lyase family protein n=1 Tax=Ciceribacter sp. L1K22 TaxID=2820275 RepID=UPI001ABDB1E4|nr:HpcH/HpaI aldolase/citrate lyase family protein [Ciceribacter sp. L1K22]MBO3761950.1 HpcH/HpaI aldolase/citrate lyase family protein [Ciceribacter sp. L1K22]
MSAPVNQFKRDIQEGKRLFGLWTALASPHAAEICAGSGFDWILIDGEHGPNDIPLLAQQLAAAARHPAHAVVRLPVGETWMIKQALDIGAQSILIPMVDTPEQALEMARACRYPPDGVRGLGASLGRASNFGRLPDYVETANEQIACLVQIESRLAISNLDAITKTDGVDGVFIGPADLSADMGFAGSPRAPDVVGTVVQAIRRIRELGKPAGIMTTDQNLIDKAIEAGANFVAIGSDVGLLVKAAADLVAPYKSTAATPSKPSLY